MDAFIRQEVGSVCVKSTDAFPANKGGVGAYPHKKHKRDSRQQHAGIGKES